MKFTLLAILFLVQTFVLTAEEREKFLHFKAGKPESGREELMLRMADVQMIRKVGDTVEIITHTHVITTRFKPHPLSKIEGASVAFIQIQMLLNNEPFKMPSPEDIGRLVVPETPKGIKELLSAYIDGATYGSILYPLELTVLMIRQEP